MKLRKLPYYVRALAALAREVAWRRQVALLARGAIGVVALRDGVAVRLGQPLDVLLLAETAGLDGYRLGELDRPPQLVVDVGAGVGDFALLVAARFPGCRVLACEPHPAQFRLLSANIRSNGAGSVEAVRVAVGTAPAYVLDDGPAHAGTRALPASAADPGAVPGRPLADLVGPARIDLLKIDCEGAEVDVLLSLGAAGLARVGRVALEYHDAAAAVNASSLLAAAGFTVERSADRYDPRLGYLHARAEV